MSASIVAAGTSSGSPLKTLMYSSDDGLTWTLSVFSFTATGRAVAWNGTKWMAGGAGSSDSVAISTDGINWTGLGIPGPGGGLADVYSIGYNGLGRWIIGGTGSPASMLYTDDDGASWTNIGMPVPSCRGIAYSSSLSRWVAVGNTNGFPSPVGVLAYSNDNGATWTSTVVTPFTSTAHGVAWNGSYWLAVGQGTTDVFATSVDGITWTPGGNTVYDTLGNPVSINSVRSAYWNGSLWVAGGGGGSGSTFTSPDAITWTIRDSTNLLNGANAVTYSGTAWIVGGNALPTNAITRSTTGLTWTSISSPFGNVEGLAAAFVVPPPTPEILVPSQSVVPQTYENIKLPSHNDIVPYNNFAVVPGIPNPQPPPAGSLKLQSHNAIVPYHQGAVVPGIPNIQPPPPGTFKQPREAKNVINRCFGSLVPNKNVPDPCAQPRSPHEKRDIQKNCSGDGPVAPYNTRLNNYRPDFNVYQVGFQQSPKARVVATWPPAP